MLFLGGLPSTPPPEWSLNVLLELLPGFPLVAVRSKPGEREPLGGRGVVFGLTVPAPSEEGVVAGACGEKKEVRAAALTPGEILGESTGATEPEEGGPRYMWFTRAGPVGMSEFERRWGLGRTD